MEKTETLYIIIETQIVKGFIKIQYIPGSRKYVALIVYNDAEPKQPANRNPTIVRQILKGKSENDIYQKAYDWVRARIPKAKILLSCTQFFEMIDYLR